LNHQLPCFRKRPIGALGNGGDGGNGVEGHGGDANIAPSPGYGVLGVGGVLKNDVSVLPKGTPDAGVVGISGFKAGFLPFFQDTASTGVVGQGAVGVRGIGGKPAGPFPPDPSGSAIGVKGSSTTDRGGVFESNQVASVRLVPSLTLKKPPIEGRAGDLLVIPDGDQQPVCSLWFCKRGSVKVGKKVTLKAIWAQVQLV
jgi:hypothetical protein